MIKVISTVSGPLIPIETLRAQCELVPIDGDSNAESHPDDDLLRAYLEAAVDVAEDYTGLSIMLRTYELALDQFPGAVSEPCCWPQYTLNKGITIPRPPLVRIDSFQADAGSDGELDEGDDWILNDFHYPARIVPTTNWPTMTKATNAIRIRYTAGYLPVEGSDTDFTASDYAGAQPLPAVIRQALLLLVRHFWENRSDSSEKTMTTIPHGFYDLLRPRRVLLGMA